jgi:hypothetical protein
VRLRTRARWLLPLLLVTGLVISAPSGTAQGAAPKAAAGDGFAGDAPVQASKTKAGVSPAIAAPTVNFEGIPATANIPILGGIPIPPDPVGDVGPSQYVEMLNTAWAVYSKTGTACCSAPSAWPPSGPASRCPTVRTTPATRSWSTTSWPTAGS